MNVARNWSSSGRTPTPELASLASYLSGVVAKVVRARDSIAGNGTPWEAPREAWALSNLMVRNIDTVLLLARHGEAHVTAAWANTRTAFEQSVRIIWLLYPADRFHSECRWLTLLAETERFHRLVAEECAQTDPDGASRHRLRADAIQTFRLGVAARLPSGYVPDLRMPPVRSMLEELGLEELYHYYREGSQYVHGTPYGTNVYRKNLGAVAEWGDFASEKDWVLPLRLCWLSLRESMKLVFDRHAASHISDPDWSALSEAVDLRFRRFVQHVTDSAGEAS